MKQFYFISGLPRSGSTLLCSLLNQNPQFQASISGPLARFTRAIIEQSSDQGGYRFQCPESKRKELILNLFDTYYNTEDKYVFFDTNRGWNLLLPLIKDLYPYTKIICCVRDLGWVLDSFERLVRNNPYNISSMFSSEENQNVYTRCETLMRPDRVVGFAYNALKQALYSEYKNSIMLVEYEQLAKNPDRILKAIYNFIGQEYYNGHYFDNLNYSYDEFDGDVNLKGLHTIKPKVEYIDRQPIIPADIINMFHNAQFWR